MCLSTAVKLLNSHWVWKMTVTCTMDEGLTSSKEKVEAEVKKQSLVQLLKGFMQN